MPSNTTSSAPGRITAGALPGVLFHYVYVLESVKDGNRYIGYTIDINRRLKEHKSGVSFSTAPLRPFAFMYFEGCRSEKDAKRSEHYLKGTQGRRFLGLRLQEYTRRKRRFTAFGAGS